MRSTCRSMSLWPFWVRRVIVMAQISFLLMPLLEQPKFDLTVYIYSYYG